MESEDLKFEFAHVGINCSAEEEAKSVAGAFAKMFDVQPKTGNSSIFAGKNIEIMKKRYLGEKGHLGFKTNNIQLAIDKLKSNGYAIDLETLKKDSEGNIKSVYLTGEFAGFAIHLVQDE